MKTYWAIKLINGCRVWVQVTTDYATWASLKHVVGPLVACGVAIAVIPSAHERTPLPPFPERVREASPVPRSSVYYPPGSLNNGPAPTVDFRRYDTRPVPAPEPSGTAVLAVGLGAVWWKRRRRT